MRVIPALLLLCLLLATIVPVSAVSPGVIKTIGPMQTVISHPVFSPVKTTAVPTTKEVCGFDGQGGYLSLESDPPGANYTVIFHKDQQVQPLTHPTLITPYYGPFFTTCSGMYFSIILRKPGYQEYTSDRFTLEQGQSYTIHAVLIPITTTTVPERASSQPATTAVITAPPYYTNPQAPMPGATSPAATAAAAGLPSQASAPGTGSLSVTTNPAGARITVDSIPAGASPATIPGLSAGMHNLTITMTGYEDLSTQVNIVAGQTMDYSTTLVPAAGPPKTRAPGFEAAVAGIALACIVLLKRAA
jgi:hypothetical protein